MLIENTLVKVVGMKEGYRFLGEYIRQVDIRNKEGKKENAETKDESQTSEKKRNKRKKN